MAKMLFQVDLKKVGWGRFAQTGLILNQKGVGASLQLKLNPSPPKKLKLHNRNSTFSMFDLDC